MLGLDLDLKAKHFGLDLDAQCLALLCTSAMALKYLQQLLLFLQKTEEQLHNVPHGQQ